MSILRVSWPNWWKSGRLLDKAPKFTIFCFSESHPSNYLATRRFVKFLKEQKSTANTSISLVVPPESLISISMSLWNVLVVKHEIVLEIKMQKRKKPVIFKYPIIICNEEVAVS